MTDSRERSRSRSRSRSRGFALLCLTCEVEAALVGEYELLLNRRPSPEESSVFSTCEKIRHAESFVSSLRQGKTLPRERRSPSLGMGTPDPYSPRRARPSASSAACPCARPCVRPCVRPSSCPGVFLVVKCFRCSRQIRSSRQPQPSKKAARERQTPERERENNDGGLVVRRRRRRGGLVRERRGEQGVERPRDADGQQSIITELGKTVGVKKKKLYKTLSDTT